MDVGRGAQKTQQRHTIPPLRSACQEPGVNSQMRDGRSLILPPSIDKPDAATPLSLPSRVYRDAQHRSIDVHLLARRGARAGGLHRGSERFLCRRCKRRRPAAGIVRLYLGCCIYVLRWEEEVLLYVHSLTDTHPYDSTPRPRTPTGQRHEEAQGPADGAALLQFLIGDACSRPQFGGL